MFMQDTYWRNKLIRRSDKDIRRKTSLTIFTSHFIANSIGVPEGPIGRVWLSLPHLVSNSARSSIQVAGTQLAVELNSLVELNWVI